MELPAFIHRHHMRSALAAASKSPDKSRKVGMVLTRLGLVQIASGCNRPITTFTSPKKRGMQMPLEQYIALEPAMMDPPLKYEFFAHAEVVGLKNIIDLSVKVSRALSRLRLMPKGRTLMLNRKATAYLTWTPCDNCAVTMVNTPVKEAYLLEPEKWIEEKWGSFFDNVDKLDAAGIKVKFVGKRLDATQVELYPKPVSYDAIKKAHGHTPKPAEPIV